MPEPIIITIYALSAVKPIYLIPLLGTDPLNAMTQDLLKRQQQAQQTRHSLVIQAGGESKRMGQDKGLMLFRGQPLVERVVQRLSPIADEVLVTTNNPELYRFLGLPLVGDLLPGLGALGGLYTALSAAKHPAVAVVACDMPFASVDLLRYQFSLLAQGKVDLVIPRTVDQLEPFHAVYRRQTCLPHIQAALHSGKRRVDAWFSQVVPRYLDPLEAQPYNPRGLAFLNINTLDELARAEQTNAD